MISMSLLYITTNFINFLYLSDTPDTPDSTDATYMDSFQSDLMEQFQTAEQFKLDYGDEVVPKEILLPLQSRGQTGNPIFFIHAIYGTVSNLKTLAQAFDRPVYGLQATSDVPSENCIQCAIFYANEIKKVQSKGPYTIVSYSYGAIIAFEMGVYLEKAGETVQLYMIDGSIDFAIVSVQTIFERKGVVKIADDADDRFDKALSIYTVRSKTSANYIQVILNYYFTNPNKYT